MAVLTAFVFASCSDNEKENPVDGKERALLNISITTPDTRATTTDLDGATDASKDKIENFKVFILDQNEDIEWMAYSSDGTDLNSITVTTDAKFVIVLANAGNIAISSKAELDAYRADLIGAGSQTAARWASGKSTELVFTQSGGEFMATTSVPLTFIAARITLTIENGMSADYDAEKVDGSLVLNSVAVLNARGTSKLYDPVSLLASPAKYYSGINSKPQFSYWPAHTVFSEVGIMKDDIAPNDFSTTYYYYVFENDAITPETFPTIVTLVGTFDGAPVYYPVHLAPYEKWVTGSGSVSSVVPGKSYNIHIKLTVDPTIEGGDADGTDDPTQPVVNAKVNVSVTLTDWVPVKLGKEF